MHNKSLEALTVSPSGHQIVVGNEYALKNDSPSGKDIATTARRALVYRDDVKGTKDSGSSSSRWRSRPPT